MNAATFIYQFKFCEFVLNRVLEEITHEMSIITPRNEGNCINWILGHIVYTRNNILNTIGEEPLYRPPKFDRYKRGTRPVGDDHDIIALEELKEAYAAINEKCLTGLNGLSDSELNRPLQANANDKKEETPGSVLAAVICHEMYHLGQMGLLRKYIGKPGAVG
jgi:uncharacterized damage-inducible protein DinB